MKEPGIPLLACISASGGVKQVSGNRLVVDFRTKTMARLATNILSSYGVDNNNNNSHDNTANTSNINTNGSNNYRDNETKKPPSIKRDQ